MRTGRPPKSAAQHKAEGNYRKDRHGDLDEFSDFALKPIVLIEAPVWLDATLVPKWRQVSADLAAMRSVCQSDLLLLEQAFRMLQNCCRFQVQLDRLNDSVERNKQMAEDLMDSLDHKPDAATAVLIAQLACGCAAEISKTSAALVAQEAAFERILGKFGIGPSERARLLRMLPKPKDPNAKTLDELLE